MGLPTIKITQTSYILELLLEKRLFYKILYNQDQTCSNRFKHGARKLQEMKLSIGPWLR